MIRLSIEEIDKRLEGRSIKRIGEYKDTRTKVNFICLICEYKWNTIPTRIWRGVGCPKCSSHLPLTNEIIDQRLRERPIQRIDEYTGYGKLLSFRCLNDDCGFEWKAKPANVIDNQSGCPICKNKLKNEKIIIDALKNNYIEFEYHKQIKNISFINNIYSVDFWLPRQKIIVEYNGIQHYTPTRFGGISNEKAVCNFEKQQIRDEFVQEWCDKMNIQLIWIDGRNQTPKTIKHLISNYIVPIILGVK